MKAAVLHAAGQFGLEEVPRPEPGPGEILVRVAACGICHTDLHYIDHGVATFKSPVILGHEISSTVAAAGPGAGEFATGDAVLLPAVFTCGDCRACRTGRENICERMRMLGNHIDGGYAEYVVAPARDCFHLPAEIPLAEACLIDDAIVRQVGVIEEITLTGGVTKNRGMVRAIEERLGSRVNVSDQGDFAGALGAALLGRTRAKQIQRGEGKRGGPYGRAA